jgi:glutamyl-tRNA synthetase
MILGHDGKRMSKRHGAVSVTHYAEQGILPEALLNYLVRLGWSHGDQEIFSRQEMIDLFSLEHINNSAATFDVDKLLWLNQHYIKSAAKTDLSALLKKRLNNSGIEVKSEQQLEAVVGIQQDRVKTMQEMADQSQYFFADFEEYEEKAAKKFLQAASLPILAAMHEKLSKLPAWSAQAIHQCVEEYSQESELKLGKIAPPLRVAACGTSNSPSIDITLETIGRDTVLARLQKAITYINEQVEQGE